MVNEIEWTSSRPLRMLSFSTLLGLIKASESQGSWVFNCQHVHFELVAHVLPRWVRSYSSVRKQNLTARSMLQRSHLHSAVERFKVSCLNFQTWNIPTIPKWKIVLLATSIKMAKDIPRSSWQAESQEIEAGDPWTSLKRTKTPSCWTNDQS